MTVSYDFKDWWNEARRNGGYCEISHTWWDSNGSKEENKRIVPGSLSPEKLLKTITPSALMKTPAHYYANYSDSTWHKLADKVNLQVVKVDFEEDGYLVKAVLGLDVYKSMYIESNDVANSVSLLFDVWERFCNQYPGAGQCLTVNSKDGNPLIMTHMYRGLNDGERLVAEAAFEEVTRELKADEGIIQWVDTMVKHRGQSNKSFSITEDIWFGRDNPTMRRVRQDIKARQKQGLDTLDM